MKTQELYRAVFILGKLKRISGSVNRIDCQCCNGFETEHQGALAERRQLKLLAEAGELAKELGLHIYHQCDPRGASLYLLDKEEDKEQYYRGIAL